jgi:glycosyltransferase involved in cell wall biosynthesis
VRLLYFSDNSSGHNRRFLEKLASSGHEVWFLDSSRRQALQDWLPTGVRYWPTGTNISADVSPYEYQRFLPELQNCIHALQPDLIHAGPVQSCAYLAALAGFHPTLVTSWGSDILLHANRDAEWREATIVALSGADGFLCDCDAVRHAAREFAVIPDSKTVQLPWGIKPGVFYSAGKVDKSAKLSDSECISFISTRTWAPLYGISTLIEAFSVAYSQDPRLRLLLLNDGPEADLIRGFIVKHKLEKIVMTPGIIEGEDLPQWFRSAHGYISCTIADGTSISLLEAMATGLPVVVSDIPANREWVAEGENGALASPGSAEGFAEKILWVANLSAEEISDIAERNKRIVSERADWDRNFPRLLNFYDQLVSPSLVASGGKSSP